MDPLAPKIVPNTPAVNAPQTTPSGPAAGKAFAKEIQSSALPQTATTGAKQAGQFQRISQSIQQAVNNKLDRAAAFKQVVSDEVKAKFGSRVPAATVEKAVASLSESPHMQKLFDRLYEKTTGKSA